MAMRVTKPPKKKEAGKTYEVGKSYEWRPENEFILTGNEFSLLYNYFRVKAPEANATMEVFKVLQGMFEAGIKEGTITEVPENKVTVNDKNIEPVSQG